MSLYEPRRWACSSNTAHIPLLSGPLQARHWATSSAGKDIKRLCLLLSMELAPRVCTRKGC